MKASNTWSHDSQSLIVVGFVAVVEVGCGVKVGCIRMRAGAAGCQRIPHSVVGRVMVITVRNCQQNCRSLQRHFVQLSERTNIQLSTLFN